VCEREREREREREKKKKKKKKKKKEKKKAPKTEHESDATSCAAAQRGCERTVGIFLRALYVMALSSGSQELRVGDNHTSTTPCVRVFIQLLSLV